MAENCNLWCDWELTWFVLEYLHLVVSWYYEKWVSFILISTSSVWLMTATHDCCTILNKRPRNYPTIYVSHIKITGKNIILLWVVKWKSPPLPMYFSSWNSYSKPHTWDGNVPRLFIFNLELLHSNLNALAVKNKSVKSDQIFGKWLNFLPTNIFCRLFFLTDQNFYRPIIFTD